MEKILVVDDERDNLELIRQVLELEGMVVQCAASGEEALQIILRRSFLLMITDFNMPGLNGLELTLKVREIAPDMPIILSTGDISPEIPQLAAEIGITKVLDKPFHPDELLETVRELVAKQKNRTSSPKETVRKQVGGIRIWSCHNCSTRYEGWSSLNICSKCGYEEKSQL